MLLNNLFNYIFLFNYLILFTIIKSDSTTSTNLLNTINTPYDLNTIIPYDVVYNIIYSYIENQKGPSNDIKFPQIIISDKCISKLKNGDPTAKIVIGKIFIKLAPNINANNDISDIVGYKFYLETNAGLQYINIGSLCGGDIITYYLPLYPDDDSLETKYQNVIIQNPDSDDEDSFLDYDIFNPDADIYNDICTTITFSVASENVGNADTSFTNYDITLHERRKYYYPGSMALCPTGFTYKGIDKENFLSKCQTTINSEISSGIMSDGGLHPHTFNIFSAKSDFKKGKKDIYFSMDVFKCIKLPFTYRGFKNNYGSYFMLVIIFIVLACYFILLLAGKYHLLSVLEFIYNSNIKSMNYLKQINMYNNINNNNQVIQYDVRSNNNLASSHQALTSNGQLLSNMLVGNNYLYNPNTEKIPVSKNNGNTNKKDKKGKEKMMSNVDELENDFESEKGNEDKDKDKTIIQNINNKDVNILNVKDKNKKNDLLIEKEEKISKNSIKSKKEEEEEDDDNESDEESESNKSDNKKEKNNKSNPPKKKGENGDDNNEEENGKKEKKRKSIEISLNVKDLRDMMFKNQKQQSESIKVPEKKEEDKKSRTKSKDEKLKSKPKRKSKNYENNNNIPPNNFPFPFFPPYGIPPGYPPYANQGGGLNEETEKLKKELEYQKELNERRDRELRREREDMLQRERELQRQREYDLERERRLRDMEMMYGNKNEMERFQNMLKNNKNAIKRGSALWNDDSDLISKERERFNQTLDKNNEIKEKLEKKILEKKEENEKIQKDLDLIKEEQKLKQIEFEKELLKTNQELKEQFEKEKKELIETKDREIQILKEDKDRELQKLKEDKDREIDLLKKDMKQEIKKKDDKIKKKEKLIEKQKRQTIELKKDLTTNNTFYTNNNFSTLRQNYIYDTNNNNKKEQEKIDSPKVVISINSIFTDQELNAMNFEQSCKFDKRSLCQIYLSYINRKQPLFFFFNYNNTSSGMSIFQIDYQSIRFIIICIDFMVYMFIYCTFFGTKSIALIYQKKFNFRMMCILGIIISPFCLIIRSIIHHFVYDPMNKKIAEIKMRCYTNFQVGKKKEEMKVNEFKNFWESEGDGENKEEIEKKEEIEEIQDIEYDDNISEGEKERRKDKYEKRKLKQLIKETITLFKKKILISFLIMIFVLIFIWIYVSCFCAVYKNSQLKFFVSILVCYGFSNLIPFVYCLFPTILKQDAIRDESELSHVIANLFQII